MNITMNFLNQMTPLLQNILLVAALAGGIFVFRSAKKTGIIKIQSDTIEAMQRQIDALKEQTAQQQKKIDQQEFKLQAMQEALKDEGILITIDGERVTIKDAREPDTTRHIIRKPTKKIATTAVVKKTEEGQ